MKKLALSVVLAGIILGGLAAPGKAQFEITVESIENKSWGIGVQVGWPFIGLSIRYWVDELLGVEVNFMPMPSWDGAGKVGRLDLNISARALWRLRNNPWIDFYGTGGLAMTLSLLRGEDAQIRAERSAWLVFGGFGLEIDNLVFLLPFPRMASCAEYGITWNMMDLLDIRLLSGGVCVRYYI
ncbi:MAG: hypothetical protein NZO41_01335 [Candidatus Bipolaricaulota bacterium]|nr:hypothetical protein [Candidatus Bipolaricaulota bacterium]MDW8141406.1 hypothetical protein [Candidatus Bipolaricaulota bacterium]